MDELKLKLSGKPFEVSKWEVWEAYQQVRRNQGWFPPAVRAVEIAKPHGGGTRMLGIPCVADRVAQTVVARRLEVVVEPVFHEDSFGYRPGRSALEAVERCRERCWRRDWVIDLDVARFFDSVPWDLIVKAVEAHTDVPWVVLYVKRWLAAPVRMPDGTVAERDRGTPQGSPISPVLANLFMHYAFDAWLEREFPTVQFERYADDAVLHCVTERQAHRVLAALQERMAEVGLRLHPDKTRVVYCKGQHEAWLVRTHLVHLPGVHVLGAGRAHKGWQALPVVPARDQQRRLKKISGVVRSWRLHRRVNLTFAELATMITPVVAGWMQYYGHFRRSALYTRLARINAYLVRWIRKKYRRLQALRTALRKLAEITQRYPRLYAHWRWVPWTAR